MSEKTTSSNSVEEVDQHTADSYLYVLQCCNPTEYINSTNSDKIFHSLFNKYTPLPFSENEDKSDLTDETKPILLIPYFLGITLLQIPIENGEKRQEIRKDRLIKSKKYFQTFLDLILQFEQIPAEYINWILPYTSQNDDEEELSTEKLQKKKELEGLMSDRNIKILKMKAKMSLEKQLFNDLDGNIHNDLNLILHKWDKKNKEEDDNTKMEFQIKPLTFSLFIQFCVFDTLEQIGSIQREEEILTFALSNQSEEMMKRQFLMQQQMMRQQQIRSTNNNINNSQNTPNAIKVNSLQELLNQKNNIQSLGYGLHVLPNSNQQQGRTQPTSSKKGNNNISSSILRNSGVSGSNYLNKKDQLRNQVFGPYVPPPTKTIEEFAREEMENLRIREEKEKSQQKEKKEEDELNSDEEEEELKKKRNWDDWKDDNPKGSGNLKR
ncbi:hypothetical protein ABK040_012976 [Willaertia magna]